MKRFICLATAILTLLSLNGADTYIIDASTGEPVIAAVVFSRSGNIIGSSDVKGHVDNIDINDYPITVKCLGLKPLIATNHNDTVYMTPDVRLLNEVVVTPSERPIMSVLCYIREYTSGCTATDTIQYFGEHMAMFYIPKTKIKGFKTSNTPQILASRLYQRNSTESGDSVFCPKYRNDNISWLDILSYPDKNAIETDRIKQGARTDSVMGKHYIKTLARKNDRTYTVTTDLLADKKDHRMSPFIFKMLGFTIDFNELTTSWAYKSNDKGVYRPEHMLYGTCSISVAGKGKWIKKAFRTKDPVILQGLFEIYPVKIDHLTTEEAKDMLYANPPTVRLEQSEYASPLPQAIQQLVNKATSNQQ